MKIGTIVSTPIGFGTVVKHSQATGMLTIITKDGAATLPVKDAQPITHGGTLTEATEGKTVRTARDRMMRTILDHAKQPGGIKPGHSMAEVKAFANEQIDNMTTRANAGGKIK